jgi:glutamine---fructose-6-phosphate transaminase (isomerizing)
MCGIFGICAIPAASLSATQLQRITSELFRLSESRGKEAAGLALRSETRLSVLKQPMPASRLIRHRSYRSFFAEALELNEGESEQPLSDAFALVGHSRLTTNGLQYINHNNQPVIAAGMVGVHNGIVTNETVIRERFPSLPHRYEVDTEVFLGLLSHCLSEEEDLGAAIRSCYGQIEGTAAVGILGENLASLLLATNYGALYTAQDSERRILIFSSERYILQQFSESASLPPGLQDISIRAVRANEAVVVNLDDLSEQTLLIQSAEARPIRSATPASKAPVVDYSEAEERGRRALRRCVRCVLPETLPFIRFDRDGVCNFCHDYEPMNIEPEAQLERQLEGIRSKNGDPDCIVMLSGGRDSCYGLHYIKNILGMNPIAYTYDWGVITDLARRNCARMCGRLGVEHILVSADIARKRQYVRKNVHAWLKRPDLGMVPLFMAGDKQYYYYANRLRQQTGLDTIFVCECPLELTKFKAGFCGIEEGNRRLFDISAFEKIRLAWYYGRQYLRNPSYINASLLDSVFAYFSSYVITHDYTFLYRYHRWDEDTISSTLIQDYDWELSPDSKSTWRIGDGTAPFYNYIYHTVAGFTENETLRSNQIREGVMSRDEALRKVEEENRPRWDSIEWYARTIGLDLDQALTAIHTMPKLYVH